MARRTRTDLLALVYGHHTNKADTGEQVYISRDEREAYGETYKDAGPKSAKSYNHRANRLRRHGWVKDVSVSDVAPGTRAVGTLTEKGAGILEASIEENDEWQKFLAGEIGVGEFINAVTDSSN